MSPACALIFLQKLRISPDTAFSLNEWAAFVIFITVIGGIGRLEWPIVGTILFFVLRQTLADLGSAYLLILGAFAILVMLKAPKGLWGLVVDRFGWQVFPLQRRVVAAEPIQLAQFPRSGDEASNKGSDATSMNLR